MTETSEDDDLNIIDALANMQVRIEHMVWIPSLLAIDEQPEFVINEFIENISENEHNLLYTTMPELKQFAKSYEWPDIEEVRTAIINAKHEHGFLVQFASPIRTYNPNGYYTFSWGAYRTGLAYVECEKDFLTQARLFEQECKRFDQGPN